MTNLSTFAINFIRKIFFEKQTISELTPHFSMTVTLNTTPDAMAFVAPPSYIHMGWQLESPKAVQKALDFFCQSVPCLHLQMPDPSHMIYNIGSNSVLKYRVPEFRELYQVCDYCADHYGHIPKTLRFGYIGYNDHQIVLCTSHRFADGGFYKFLVDHFLRNEYPKEIPMFPHKMHDIFKKEIAEAAPIPNCFVNPELTRYHPHDKPDKNNTTVGITMARMKATDFKMLNASKTGPKSFNESVWLSNYLVASYFTGKLLPTFGTTIQNDLRQYFKRKPTFLDCYMTSPLNVTCKVDPDMTLAEMGHNLRQDLIRRKKNGEQFAYQKSFIDQSKWNLNGLRIESSPVGRIPIKRPILDVWTGARLTTKSSGLLSFTVDNGDVNTFYLNFRYSLDMMSERDGKKLSEICLYFFKNIDHNRTVKDSFKEITDFANSLFREK